MRRVADWLGRIVLSMGGAALAAAVVAAIEARALVRLAPGASFGALFLADVAVLVPFALVLGAAAGALALVVDPVRPRAPGEHLVRLRRVQGARAIGPLATLAAGVWCVAMAHAARGALAEGVRFAASAELAAVAIVLLLSLAVAVFALAPAVDRALGAAAARARFAGDPVVTTGVGAVAAFGLLALGADLGNAGGDGPTPLAIFGVLTRKELDLRPVFELAGIAALAYVAPVMIARRRTGWKRTTAALLVAVLALAFTRREARAMNGDPRSASLVTQAPLGGPAIALLRRATDRDHDGASPLFAGGDCNDADPNIGPNAIDIPGNGIDEDCSGADLPLPEPPPAPAPPPPEAVVVEKRELSVLFVTIDTLRTDVGFLGFDKPQSPTPNLDKLAAKSTVFERAYALSSYTGKSIGPMMIGKYPGETLRDGAHFNTYFEGNTTIAERLRDAGFHTMGCASFWYFQKKYGMAQGIDDWDMSAMPYDYAAETDTSTTSKELTDVAIKLLAQNDGKRFFAWVHYFDPHAQYMGHDEAPNFYGEGVRPGEGAYLGEVWFTDHHLGRLLDYVEGQPWGKDVIIVVTGDHGEAFGEHDLMWHGSDLYEPIVRTPLLLYVPDAPPHRVPVKRSHIDLVPTLLDLLQVPQPPPGELSGVSMVGDLFPDEGHVYDERDIYLDMPPGPILPGRRAFIHGTTPGVKLLQHGFGYEQLVDLAKDPDEMQDLSWDHAKYDPVLQAEDRLRGRLHEIWVPPDPPEPKPEEQQQAASTTPAANTPGGPCTPTVLPNQCAQGHLWHCPPNADRHMLGPRCLPIPIARPAGYGTDECCP